MVQLLVSLVQTLPDDLREDISRDDTFAGHVLALVYALCNAVPPDADLVYDLQIQIARTMPLEQGGQEDARELLAHWLDCLRESFPKTHAAISEAITLSVSFDKSDHPPCEACGEILKYGPHEDQLTSVNMRVDPANPVANYTSMAHAIEQAVRMNEMLCKNCGERVKDPKPLTGLQLGSLLIVEADRISVFRRESPDEKFMDQREGTHTMHNSLTYSPCTHTHPQSWLCTRGLRNKCSGLRVSYWRWFFTARRVSPRPTVKSASAVEPGPARVTGTPSAANKMGAGSLATTPPLRP